MKITDIIQKSQELMTSWIEKGMLQDCENCGCERCLKIIESVSNCSNLIPNKE